MGARSRRLLLAAGLVLAAAGFAPRSGPRVAADTLTALPAAGVAKRLRLAPTLRYGTANAPASWHRFVAMAGGSWQAAWDAATGVPDRIWGSGIAAPGASADPAIAERVARQLLADHLALLAPGASASDFELVSNTSDGNIRSVGFVQRAGGLRVVGGQISFRFKHDRLFVIASQALPGVPPPTSARVARASLFAKATPALRAAVQLPAAPVRALGDDVVLPLIADDAVLGYRVATPLEIDGAADGRYLAYADRATGGIVAIHQLNEYAAGTVLYHGVDRWPGRGYVDRPAPRAHVTVDGAAATTSTAGGVTWSSDQPAALVTAIVGDLVSVVNMSADLQDSASAQMTIAPGGSVTWDATTVLEDDAQVQAYLDTNIAKEYVRANVDAQMPTLDDVMTVNVNLNQECNAYFDGTALNFFHASQPGCKPCCNNTALLQDVNFHEYGHRVHTAEIIAGVGLFDGAMSEGASDFLAASITGDPGMGRGFEYTDDPLRQLDPPNKEYRWPVDIDSDIHATGLIFGGTFWDLRKAFTAQYGQEAGVALTDGLYVATLRRATNIPSCLIEALAADDDDGNLANGTPHECIIRAAFAAHGMRTATGTVTQPGAIAQVTLATGVAIDVLGASSCGTDAVSSVLLGWAGAHANPPAGTVMAQQVTPTHFVATLPLSPNGSVTYHASITFADGNVMDLADNRADPKYQAFDGPMIKLYCTDFEDGDPLAAGWTATTSDKTAPPMWAWVEPGGGATNPHAAFSGTHILAQAPGGNYPPNQQSTVHMPLLYTWPYSNVHLQYRRWLAVEDSHFDRAQVIANGRQVWLNATDNLGDAATLSHVDKEWRFHELPLSGYYRGRTLDVAWNLDSDGGGLEMAGWSLDDVCVVASPDEICGDGKISTYEQCDDGSANADAPDACRTDCRTPVCGDGIVDSHEQCDDGSAGSKGCTPTCTLIPIGSGGGGCCDAGGAGGSLVLGSIVIGALVRRRGHFSRRGSRKSRERS